MILALDIGNSQIFCGVFDREELKVQVRYASKAQISSDEFGVFLRGALRENGVDPDSIRTIGISSVVPELNYAKGLLPEIFQYRAYASPTWHKNRLKN